MQIRKATSKDKEQVLAFAHALFLDIPGFYWHREEIVEGHIRRREYFIACARKRVIGAMCLVLREESAEIETLSVDKRLRGHGIGERLVKFAVRSARQRGAEELAVCSFYEYGVAGFYRKVGFKERPPKEFNGHKYHVFEMNL